MGLSSHLSGMGSPWGGFSPALPGGTWGGLISNPVPKDTRLFLPPCVPLAHPPRYLQ